MKNNIIIFLISIATAIGVFNFIIIPSGILNGAINLATSSDYRIPTGSAFKINQATSTINYELPSRMQASQNNENFNDTNPFATLNSSLTSNNSLFGNNSTSTSASKGSTPNYKYSISSTNENVNNAPNAGYSMSSISFGASGGSGGGQQVQSNASGGSFSSQLAYNNLSKPRMTLGGGTDGDEDGFETGGGEDNGSYYNDVPVGDGTYFLLLLALAYILVKAGRKIRVNEI